MCIIKPFAPSDLENIVEAYHQFRRPPWNEVIEDGDTREMVRSVLAHRYGHIFVARTLEEQFVGFAVGYALSDKWGVYERIPPATCDPCKTLYLADLVVMPDFRKTGVGAQLVRLRIEHFAMLTGVGTVDAVVRLTAADPSAPRNYAALGMREVARMGVENLKYIDGRIVTEADERLIYFGSIPIS